MVSAHTHTSLPLSLFIISSDETLELSDALLLLLPGESLVGVLEAAELGLQVLLEDFQSPVVGVAHVERVYVISLLQWLLMLISLLNERLIRFGPNLVLLLCDHVLLADPFQVPLRPELGFFQVDVVLAGPAHCVTDRGFLFLSLQRYLLQEVHAVPIAPASPNYHVEVLQSVDRETGSVFLSVLRFLFLFKVDCLLCRYFLEELRREKTYGSFLV